MKKIISKLTQFPLANQRVLLRADLNVPLAHSAIANDFRLRALLPTLHYLRSHNAITIIATHLGRPQGTVMPNLSTKILVPWFQHHGYSVIFEPNLRTVKQTDYKPGSIIMLENMRFFPGEHNQDPNFTQELASCAQYYVNDAFGTLHRHDTSVSLVATYFPPDKKTVGFLVERELKELEFLKHAQKPFILILGGGKVDTKLELIKGMLDYVTAIMLCPATVFTFLYAQGTPVGASLVEHECIDKAQEIIAQAQSKNIQLLFPLDYQIADNSLDGPLRFIDAHEFPKDAIGISIGPKTIEHWCSIIKKAKTVFLNAAMGFAYRPETLEGLHKILECLASSSAHSVVGGGDSVAAVERFGLAQKISFLSTGGGSTLAYLSGEELPGLIAIS